MSERRFLRVALLQSRGIGGFHLCCDASNEAAVSRLRQPKRKYNEAICGDGKGSESSHKSMRNDRRTGENPGWSSETDPASEQKKRCRNPLSLCGTGEPKGWRDAAVCTGTASAFFSTMMESEMPEFLVMTSGNTSGAPICRDDQEAEAELSGFVTVCCLMTVRSVSGQMIP